ncbi:MAG: hypothetical protein MK003_09045, partial [Pseudomonadales bacterium]|nr:hypothetical protein [Pseudomonadales bacterium]
ETILHPCKTELAGVTLGIAAIQQSKALTVIDFMLSFKGHLPRLLTNNVGLECMHFQVVCQLLCRKQTL